ncbi:MAG: hypothetical protein ACHQYP_07770, partial [Nitrospiria bacterium]
MKKFIREGHYSCLRNIVLSYREVQSIRRPGFTGTISNLLWMGFPEDSPNTGHLLLQVLKRENQAKITIKPIV